ncbi:MAG: hypothetical protein ACLQBC_10880 [Syntrophales bacterium]
MIIKKIISSEQKKDIKILIEDFLEKDWGSLSGQSKREENTGIYARLYQILSKNTAPMEIPDVSDLTDEELREAALEWHQILRPVWKHFKKVLFDYKENVLPERERLKTPISSVTDPSSPLYEYKELQDYVSMQVDKFYKVKIRGTSFKVTLSFDAGVISIFRRELNPVNSFIDIMRDVPIDVFAKCGYCNKVIIVVRKGKNYCPGCAAKAYQKELWRSDPEGSRKRERNRYKEKRKRKSGRV